MSLRVFIFLVAGCYNIKPAFLYCESIGVCNFFLSIGSVQNSDKFDLVFSSDNSINGTGFYATFQVHSSSPVQSHLPRGASDQGLFKHFTFRNHIVPEFRVVYHIFVHLTLRKDFYSLIVFNQFNCFQPIDNIANIAMYSIMIMCAYIQYIIIAYISVRLYLEYTSMILLLISACDFLFLVTR